MVFVGGSWDEVQRSAESGLAEIAKWLKRNLLTLNIDKTNYITFSNYNNSQPVHNLAVKIHSCSDNQTSACRVISKVEKVKYLGVIIDQRLTWHEHLELLTNRIRKLMWVFKTLRYIADNNLIRLLYISLAQSILGYCIAVWGGTTKTEFLYLERAQRSLLKLMYFKPYRYPTTELYSECNLLSVRKLYVLNITLKKHSMLSFDPNKLNKRRKHLVAAVEPVKTTYAQRQFASQSSHIYNNLNKFLNIYDKTCYFCKKTITAFLLNKNYDEIEALLCIK